MTIIKTIKVTIHLITVIVLLGAIGLIATSRQFLAYTESPDSSYAMPGRWDIFEYYVLLVFGAMLIAILLQLALILLQIKSRRDAKRLWGAIAFLLVLSVPVVVAMLDKQFIGKGLLVLLGWVGGYAFVGLLAVMIVIKLWTMSGRWLDIQREAA